MQKNDQNKNAAQEARRTLLKKAAASSGVVATAAALPNTWVKPVLNSVITPAHAQTSAPTVGVFSSTGLQASIPLTSEGPQYALLDLFFPAAHANTNVGESICGSGMIAPFNTFTLFIRVNANLSVDFAVDGGFEFDDSPIICSGTSTVVGSTIADTSISVGDFDGGSCSIELTNITASGSQLEGTWAFIFPSDAAPCGGSFTASLGSDSDFPGSATACDGLFVEIPRT